jgi:hypothetical protein
MLSQFTGTGCDHKEKRLLGTVFQHESVAGCCPWVRFPTSRPEEACRIATLRYPPRNAAGTSFCFKPMTVVDKPGGMV